MMHEPKNLLTGLAFLQRTLPRGKGRLTRAIGAALSRPNQHYLTTLHGAKLVLSPTSYDVYATMVQNENAWDYEDFRICIDSFADGECFYEIGANVGYFAVEAAHLRRDSRVYAFEPQSALTHAIEQSAKLNNLSNLTAYEVLVGDEDALRTLYLAPSSIHSSAVPDSGRDSVSTQSKQMVTLDRLVARRELRPPDFVKMDVEGSEALVFRGAAQTFRTHKPSIFLEYLPEYDIGHRVRKEVEDLVQSVDDYALFGVPNMHARSQSLPLLVPIEQISWMQIHALYILNMSRGVASDLLTRPSAFEGG
ncbi:MAG: FkbM family methyltransferase [Sphingomonadaceae bacterium]